MFLLDEALPESEKLHSEDRKEDDINSLKQVCESISWKASDWYQTSPFENNLQIF